MDKKSAEVDSPFRYGFTVYGKKLPPGLAWDAALRMSRVDLQLIIDENMYNFVENSVRGNLYDLYPSCTSQ